jgi:hypothetical protein
LSLVLAVLVVVVDNDPLNCCLLLAIVLYFRSSSFGSEEEELIRKERVVSGSRDWRRFLWCGKFESSVLRGKSMDGERD